VPNYAVSSSASIPSGYVAHARDACVNIDYQWDSMRGPLMWGDGGSYGEEWTEMHRRFRKGLQHLVDWYSQADEPTEMVTRTVLRCTPNGPGDDTECAVEDPDDEDTEAVVILVSHGAGCNAMIGAITHQPVLMDVAMASLTMAVRKPTIPEESSSTESVPIHQSYDLKLFANTEHLRSTAPTPTSARSQSVTSTIGPSRGRYVSGLGSTSYFDSLGSRSSSATPTIGTGRRPSGNAPKTPPLGIWGGGGGGGGITVGSGVTSFTSTSNIRSTPLGRTSSFGLWSPSTQETDNSFEDEDDDMLLNFSHEKTAPTTTALATPPTTAADVPSHPLPTTAPNGGPADPSLTPIDASPAAFALDEKMDTVPSLGLGLWGVPRSAMEEDPVHDLGSTKRRWTVNERA
jgi:hypothetical protein